MEDSHKKSQLAATIRERRTIRDFKPDAVALEDIKRLLNDAVWAPNHGFREPWRFILFHGEGRKVFAEAVSEGSTPEQREKYGKKMYDYYMLIPIHIVVVMDEDPRQKQWEEDFAATAALIQNFQLLAWEEGLGVVWKTNNYSWHPNFRERIGVLPGEKVVGTLHVGYIKTTPKAKARTEAEKKLTIVSEA
ncbi:nitroreductase [Salipaludibacillus agaradhaerens]|uniref:nitroreductase family protein n=1 Tax=Salipaludibacillus agaradhaerens TaxID=76935 RepID=UPI0021513872|nr:nitroreductase [Salipaludibacillus agaradhaerens]MCR6106080.1 nitroreductase [Salipaludibacillus agaradhaerens]MCR6118113.1 nitroreductase [Salipaludibacillus agaradhaerens]UJW57240.1 nitroreductase [Bacillus sp. A116_S68]